MKSSVILLDFDGTVVTHEYPKVGKDIGAVPVLKALTDNGHKLILFTMRSGKELKEALDWFTGHDIPLWAVNENPDQWRWTSSPKVHGNYEIDDRAIGCPVIRPIDGSRPYADWHSIIYYLEMEGLITPDQRGELLEPFKELYP